MPDRVKLGTGMMERPALLFDITTDADAISLFEYLRAHFPKSAAAVREENAHHVRYVIEKALAKEDHPDLFLGMLPDSHPLRIMADWLRCFDRITAERAKPAPDVSRIIDIAEERGRLQERYWSRAGIDRDTGARREALALERRGPRVAYGHDNEGRDTVNAERKRKAEVWREIAWRVARENPEKRGKLLEAAITNELKRHRIEAPSWETVRKVIPKRENVR